MEFRKQKQIDLNEKEFTEKFDRSIFTKEFLLELYNDFIDTEHNKCKMKFYNYPESITDDEAKETLLSLVNEEYGDKNKESVKNYLINDHIEREFYKYERSAVERSIEFDNKKRRYEAMNNIGIPYNLYHASKDDFEDGTMEELFKQKNVLMQGESDTGKSHLSVAFIKYLGKEKNIPINDMYIFYEEYFLVASYEKSLEIFKELINVPFLIIDDLGSMGIGEHKRELLKGVIFERIREDKPTWITTNSTIGAIYDQRTASKIIGEYTIVKKKRTGTRLENKKEIEI